MRGKLPPPITSRTNARVKELRASLSGKAGRAGELLGMEGEHLIGEALRSGLRMEAVFVREGSEAGLERLGLGETPAVVLSRDVFESALTTASPQGVAATWRIVEPETRGPVQRALVLEHLQDPGNLGTLIRSFEAFGAGEVFVTPGTASVWNPKTLRSSAGSAFRVPVRRMPLAEIVGKLRGEGVRMFAATVREDGAVGGWSPEVCFDLPYAILVGNEGAGLSREAVAAADAFVTIPTGVESLNAAVAGSILLYEAMRQERGRRG